MMITLFTDEVNIMVKVYAVQLLEKFVDLRKISYILERVRVKVEKLEREAA